MDYGTYWEKAGNTILKQRLALTQLPLASNTENLIVTCQHSLIVVFPCSGSSQITLLLSNIDHYLAIPYLDNSISLLGNSAVMGYNQKCCAVLLVYLPEDLVDSCCILRI